MASTSQQIREYRHPLTEAELQREADNLWENETESEIGDDMFGGEESDEDYVEEQLSDSNSEQSENEDEKVRCCFCGKGKDRKTKFVCSLCRRPYCMEHRAQLCCECEHQDPRN